MIFEDVQKARDLHYKAIEAYLEAQNELADAEYEHAMQVGRSTSGLRASGIPATLIPKLAAGELEVNQANRKLSMCKGVAKACEMRVQATYKDWKDATDQYEREWRLARQ